jgi:hypothetical protein
VLIQTEDIANTPASGASLVVMVVSSIIDGDVVMPIFESDSQQEEVEFGRQFQVCISDAASATSTVLVFETVYDAKDLAY